MRFTHMLRGLAAATLSAFLATSGAAQAAADSALTIRSGDAVEHISLDALRAMPRTVITTHTEFTDGPTAFSGPLAREVLTPPEGATVAVMTAVNDYTVEIPLEDFARFDVVLALEVDGRPLSRRDKGPIWVMYPMDDHRELQSPIYVNRLIWQLSSVTFR